MATDRTARTRRAEVILALYEVLAEHPEGLHVSEAVEATQKVLPPTAYEEEVRSNGQTNYRYRLGWDTAGPNKYGWLEKKRGLWRLTDAGRRVLEEYAGRPDAYQAEAERLWRAWEASRPLAGGRAWLVRGSNVSGQDLVQRLWLSEGLVSLPASRLRGGAHPGADKETLRCWVEEDYESTTYNQKQELVEALHAFLSRVQVGDTVCTLSSSSLHLGRITGDAIQLASPDGRSNLRRPVEWEETAYPYDELPEEVQQKISTQHDLLELTAVVDLLNSLGLSAEEIAQAQAEAAEDPSVELPVLPARELDLPQLTRDLAARLMIHDLAWLQEVRDLLWDERQLVFYGPPGTGKTYLAQEIAAFLGGGPEQVKLVQFHPSYSYEDFFEGFRPREDAATGQVSFRLTAGPLRELADLASREGNRHIPHFLIIDELNRANLAKVFGELYFLLEYRNKSVRLTYSAEDFALPSNVFIIGTMNTADRSIALVDAAMRRRFAFVELSPAAEPTRGLLRRWLAREGHGAEPADLLDELNQRITDPDFRIGPSYLMRRSVYRDAASLERTWRTKILPLLEEHHYGEGIDIERRYGLPSLRRALAPGMAPDVAPGLLEPGPDSDGAP